MTIAHDLELVGEARGLENSNNQEAQEAAVRIAGSVEHIANTKGVSISEAIELFEHDHKHDGGHYSVVKRCVDYDAA